MSRGIEGRYVAWQVWIHFHTLDGQAPIAYEHQCGAIGRLEGDLSDIMCPGCRHELGRPERECEPLYGTPKAVTR